MVRVPTCVKSDRRWRCLCDGGSPSVSGRNVSPRAHSSSRVAHTPSELNLVEGPPYDRTSDDGRERRTPRQPKPAGRPRESDQDQKSQSSSSVFTALPITYDEPDPEKKSWFSSAFGDRAERMAGFTSVMFFGNIGS